MFVTSADGTRVKVADPRLARDLMRCGAVADKAMKSFLTPSPNGEWLDTPTTVRKDKA